MNKKTHEKISKQIKSICCTKQPVRDTLVGLLMLAIAFTIYFYAVPSIPTSGASTDLAIKSLFILVLLVLALVSFLIGIVFYFRGFYHIADDNRISGLSGIIIGALMLFVILLVIYVVTFSWSLSSCF